MRLENRVAIVVGAGQTPGETIGNGRATAILFAREGARVLLVDKRVESALETEAIIKSEGGIASSCAGDVSVDADCLAFTNTCVERYGKIDILHHNVGIGVGDRGPIETAESVWDKMIDVNLKGAFLTSKHVLPIMREAGSGSLIFISSIAAICSMNAIAYKASKAGMNSLSQAIAIDNAPFGIRSNVIMPGLMDTPIAIEGISKMINKTRDQVRARRDAQVPLGSKMGSAWDVANAALFLASDEASFITGINLPVDGGQSARIG
jgi:NAD(P)-dependent dehydrogenase (short-subunit alcohol dehydrogenase family)